VRTWIRYLWGLSAFAFGLGTIYWFITYEWTGAVLLWAMSLMPSIVAMWATRHGLARSGAEEDDPEADPGASAGTSVGSFPLTTGWPVVLVLGVVVVGAGLVYGLILLPAGVGLMGWAIFGLMRESRG
jgi:hypothetical protein